MDEIIKAFATGGTGIKVSTKKHFGLLEISPRKN